MSLTRAIKKEDLLRNLGSFLGTLSFNNGCVGALFPNFHLYEDGRFGEHDYSHVPQYYEEAYCHLPLIPQQPTGILEHHPYLDYAYMWDNAVLNCLVHVAMDTLTIQVLVATAQRFWLEIITALDYMDWVKPVMDGIKPLDPAHKAEHRIGTFTWDVGATQLFLKAWIPVFFIHPWESFTNQVILCVIKLSPTKTCTIPPAHPFPIVFAGPPSDSKKYITQHRCLCRFQRYRDPFNFRTVPSSAGSSTAGCPKNKKISNNISQDKFADLHGDYAPTTISAWSNALSSINKESEHFQTHFPNPVITTYMFPDPLIINNANMQWHDLLALALKHADGPSSSRSKNSSSVKGFKAVEAMLGSWMHSQGVLVQLVLPPSSDDQPFDVHHSQRLIWELCELNFHYELLALDNCVAQEPVAPLKVSATANTISDFTSNRQNDVLAVFPGGSMIPSTSAEDDGFAGEWTRQWEQSLEPMRANARLGGSTAS
ncbi:hypothetical protein F5146DRAFT_1002454 [Armillaria mellea]|nr:hypothetical protein F5146DRAFT_1002454 [Armillaria mellea]